MNKPKARTKDLLVQEPEKELLSCDLDAHKAFCLNETTALICQFCDGSKWLGEITKEIELKTRLVMNWFGSLNSCRKENDSFSLFSKPPQN